MPYTNTKLQGSEPICITTVLYLYEDIYLQSDQTIDLPTSKLVSANERHDDERLFYVLYI